MLEVPSFLNIVGTDLVVSTVTEDTWLETYWVTVAYGLGSEMMYGAMS
jgi:hypothetical protein